MVHSRGMLWICSRSNAGDTDCWSVWQIQWRCAWSSYWSQNFAFPTVTNYPMDLVVVRKKVPWRHILNKASICLDFFFKLGHCWLGLKHLGQQNALLEAAMLLCCSYWWRLQNPKEQSSQTVDVGLGFGGHRLMSKTIRQVHGGFRLAAFAPWNRQKLRINLPKNWNKTTPKRERGKLATLQNSTKKHNQKHGISHKKSHAISPRSTKTFKKRRQESTSKAQNFEQKRFQILSQTHIKALSRGSEKIETAKRNTWTFLTPKKHNQNHKRPRILSKVTQ